MDQDYRLVNDRLSVGLSRKGGALTWGRTAEGRDFLSPGGEAGRACFPMVPVCNRVAGNHFPFRGRDHHLAPNTGDPLYLHGDGWLSEWQAVDMGADRAVLALDHDAGPFRYRAEQSVALEDNSLSLRLSVVNHGTEPMPFGLGYHPYFPRDGSGITFGATARWTEGPGHLPAQRQTDIPAEVDFTQQRPIPAAGQNNAYDGWPGQARIDWPGMTLVLTADPLFGALMLYAPAGDRRFFCLEPMSHLPDALNHADLPGLQILDPGAALSGAIRMTITEGEPRP